MYSSLKDPTHTLERFFGADYFVQEWTTINADTCIYRKFGVAITFYGSTHTLLVQGKSDTTERLINILDEDLPRKDNRPKAKRTRPVEDSPRIPPWKQILIADIKNYVKNDDKEKKDLLQSLSLFVEKWGENN